LKVVRLRSPIAERTPTEPLKPGGRIKHQQRTKPGRTHAQARLRLEPTHRTRSTQAFAGLQSVFYVMVFVSQHTCSTFIFFKRQKKIKELQPTAQTKTHAKKTA